MFVFMTMIYVFVFVIFLLYFGIFYKERMALIGGIAIFIYGIYFGFSSVSVTVLKKISGYHCNQEVKNVISQSLSDDKITYFEYIFIEFKQFSCEHEKKEDKDEQLKKDIIEKIKKEMK